MDTSPRPISTQLGRFLDPAATIATWWFFKVGQFLIRLEMIRLDCSCAGLRTADETSAVGRTTAAPLVEQQHNSVYTTAQEIRQRKYIKDALTSFNPHTGIQFIHLLRWLRIRIRFRKCQMQRCKKWQMRQIYLCYFFQLVLIFGPFWVIFGLIWAILGHFS